MLSVLEQPLLLTLLLLLLTLTLLLLTLLLPKPVLACLPRCAASLWTSCCAWGLPPQCSTGWGGGSTAARGKHSGLAGVAAPRTHGLRQRAAVCEPAPPPTALLPLLACRHLPRSLARLYLPPTCGPHPLCCAPPSPKTAEVIWICLSVWAPMPPTSTPCCPSCSTGCRQVPLDPSLPQG